METPQAIARRRMTRAFAATPLPVGRLDEMLDLARRAPSAGNTQAVEFIVLDRPETVARYWDTTLPPAKRAGFRWQQLLTAPVLVLLATRPASYVERYGQEDKARPGLGESLEQWPVPYWWVDAGAVAQNLLLLATDSGLGACLFGPFDHEPALKAAFALDDELRLVATIALGYPLADEPGRSSQRPRPSLATVLTRPE